MKIAERHQIMKYLVRTGKKKLSETPELTKEVKSDTKVIAKKENPNYYKQKMIIAKFHRIFKNVFNNSIL